MQRQITFYKFEVGIRDMLQRDDGLFELRETPVTTVEASHMTKGEARKAILKAGADCPRGTDVYWHKTGKVRYYFETDALLAAATSREDLPL